MKHYLNELKKVGIGLATIAVLFITALPFAFFVRLIFVPNAMDGVGMIINLIVLYIIHGLKLRSGKTISEILLNYPDYSKQTVKPFPFFTASELLDITKDMELRGYVVWKNLGDESILFTKENPLKKVFVRIKKLESGHIDMEVSSLYDSSIYSTRIGWGAKFTYGFCSLDYSKMSIMAERIEQINFGERL